MKELIFKFRQLPYIKAYMNTKFYKGCSKFVDSTSARKQYQNLSDLASRKKFFKKMLITTSLVVFINLLVVIFNFSRFHSHNVISYISLSLTFLNLFIVIIYSYIVIEVIRGYKNSKVIDVAKDLNLL